MLYAIGDIHGNNKKLSRLLSGTTFHKDDTIIFVGDYVDRGPDSFEVVETLLKLKEEHNCIFLKGNHEDIFLNALKGINIDMCLSNGGNATLQSYEKHGYPNLLGNGIDCLPKEHQKFFMQQPYYHETDEYIFVHGGLKPGVPLALQTPEDMLWIREPFINSDYDWGKKVIFGHTPFEAVYRGKNKIGIDTGAFRQYGKLTCLELPSELVMFASIL